MNLMASESLDDNLLEVIRRALPGLRKSDRRVAETILEAPLAATEMTLAALAEASGVSEPTVLRFCTAIGCDGFRDLRVKLARSLAFSRSTSHTAISPEDDLGTIITKIFDFNLSNLAWARSKLDPQRLAAAVETLSSCDRIEFFGFGASGIVARDAQQKFPLFGVPCGAPTDGHQMFMTAAMVGPRDVIVAISNTGTTREVVQATRLAKERGARTIGITGSESSLLRHCDIGIVVETLENTDVFTPTISRVAAMVIIDILSTAVSLGRDEAHRARIADMKRHLAEMRASGIF
ncbi:MAG: MurR/RpiR family transcriptional regulator [Geminicoccaceae bacterium]|nr:MurR/RpiR family transcriptional regulator [Geminicoccaceae bacterium]